MHTHDNTSTLASAAIEYAKAGHAVFPLRPGSKMPSIPKAKGGKGFLDATADVDRVTRWWTAHPNDNIGIRPAPGQVVIDVDTKEAHGDDGYATLADLIGEHGKLPDDCPCAETPNDGLHYWLRVDGDDIRAALGPGVELKGHSTGYVVAPPSIVNGRQYQWRRPLDGQPPQAPTEFGWADAIRKPNPKPKPTPASKPKSFDYDGPSPIDEFEDGTTWSKLLAPEGWTLVTGDGDGDGSQWRRPGKADGYSASIKHGQLFVHSSSTDFEQTVPGEPHGYTKFHAYAVLRHSGDRTAARAAIGTRKAHNVNGAEAPPTQAPICSSTKDSAGDFPTPKLWGADQLAPAKPVEWLAANRIPRAAVCLLVGDEGIGKSLFWIWIVAAITTGTALPRFGIPAREPEDAIIVVTEDDWSTVVRPRLEVAGADLSRIKVMCSEDDGSGAPVFPRDLPLITDSGIRPAILVIDAWLDTVSAQLQVKDPQQARIALHPFKEIASKTGMTVMPLVHTNRIDTANARDKYGITMELRKKCRMTLYALENEDGRLVVGPEKANLTRLLPATVFSRQSVQYFDPTPDSDGTVPKLWWHADSDMTIRDHLAEMHAVEHSSDSSDALAWLAEYLASGPVWKSHIDKAAEAKGFSFRRLETAKRKLGVRSMQGHDGARSAWFWCLPQHADQTPKGPV